MNQKDESHTSRSQLDKLFWNVDAANANTHTQIVIYYDVNIFEIYRFNDDDDDASLSAFRLDFRVWKRIFVGRFEFGELWDV